MSARRLLVIDDSPTIRKLVELSFAASRWTVEFASSGHDGIEKAREKPPDVILLDFVLPDMRGTDVCRALATGPATADTPVIVMSAKHDNVRELFEPFAAVADFIGKPFAATEVVARVDGLANRSPRPVDPKKEPAGAPGLSFEQKQAAAQALYGKLRQKFASIPQLMSQLDTAAPAAFFARKLLTPQLVDELFVALRPFFQQRRGPEVATPAGGKEFAGTLGGVSAVDLIRVLSSGNRTGELRLTYSDRDVLVSIVEGEVVLVTSDDPELCLRGDPAFGAPGPAVVGKAELGQRSTGVPLVVALARACEIPEPDVPAVVGRVGRFLLLHTVESPPLGFSWSPKPRGEGPSDEFAMPIALADLELAILRGSKAGAEPEPNLGEERFSRGENFSKKIRLFTLAESERQVLAVVDDQRTAAEIAERSELPLDEATRVLGRLLRVGLLRRYGGERREGAGPLLVADPDVASFVEPLRKLLEDAAPPIRVVSVPVGGPLHETVRSETPRMVLVNASAPGANALHAAEAIRSDDRLVQPRLVAVLDAPAPDEAGRLATAGFDAVLTKPIRRVDLERLLRSQVG